MDTRKRSKLLGCTNRRGYRNSHRTHDFLPIYIPAEPHRNPINQDPTVQTRKNVMGATS